MRIVAKYLIELMRFGCLLSATSEIPFADDTRMVEWITADSIERSYAL